MRAALLLFLLSSSACAPCGYDSAILSGQVTGMDGRPLTAGRVELVPDSGESREVSLFGEGRYEASLPAGSWEVVAYDADDACFSVITPVALEPCDETGVNLEIIDCFR